jgi:hypothetical protein
MVRGVSSSSSKPARKAEASGSGSKRAKTHPDSPFSQPGQQPSGPAAKRAKSLPPHLPSNPFQPAEVKAARKPITRPKPDARPPLDFRHAGGTLAAAELKQKTMSEIEENHYLGDWLVPKIEGSDYYKDFLESIHPRIAFYSEERMSDAYNALAHSHPRLTAEIAKKRNRLYGIPNYPTSSRMMKPAEQRFLSNAMRLMQEDIAKKPFHMHGESGAVGGRNGNITQYKFEPRDAVSLGTRKGDKYAIHSHPPFGTPFDFSASEADHRVAAETYPEYGNQMNEYLTNGKDVLHIQPDSLELVQLHPDPKSEKKLGKFPVAFTLPDPQHPPRPFANHEAPAAFRGDWAPPAGWEPPEDYPKTQPGEQSASEASSS